MTEPLFIPWSYKTQIRRILLSNGRVVDLEEPVNDSRQTFVATIREHYGDNVKDVPNGYTILPEQQEPL